MSRTLVKSPRFTRTAKRIIKSDPVAANSIQAALETLVHDPSDPRLKTHKLAGKLDNVWACSAGYDLRILFQFIEEDGREAILLLAVGTHDEVY